ncbi:hypothetical protein DL95DRAFT_418380 [Leptodontidium sp. 2 PMI_412]|nr:hypothetical protein DL95DRAFT_418380 [Leptodontidium sp. 2 PMI_412]
MRYLIPRALISARTFIVPKFSRAHHSATARFTTTSPEGTLVTRDIEVWLGEPAQAYVMFDPEISKTFQTSGRCSRRLLPNTRPGVTCPELPPRYPALFSSAFLVFELQSSPYPRLEIPQDLPRQSDASNTSPATLHGYGYGVTHAITLDGTPDGNGVFLVPVVLTAFSQSTDVSKFAPSITFDSCNVKVAKQAGMQALEGQRAMGK